MQGHTQQIIFFFGWFSTLSFSQKRGKLQPKSFFYLVNLLSAPQFEHKCRFKAPKICRWRGTDLAAALARPPKGRAGSLEILGRQVFVVYFCLRLLYLFEDFGCLLSTKCNGMGGALCPILCVVVRFEGFAASWNKGQKRTFSCFLQL